MRIALVGVELKHRSFSGANKALPVLASSLHNAGFSSIQLDMERQDVPLQRVLNECATADLVAICGAMTPQWQEVDEVTRQLRTRLDKVGRHNAPILVGGYATKSAQDILTLTPWITALYDGEGEKGIVEIAKAIAAGDFERTLSIKGVCSIDEGGQFRVSCAERVQNLDPYDQGFGMEYSPKHDMGIFQAPDGRQLRTAQVYDQRGCPFTCQYCNKSLEGKSVVWVDDESFRQELRRLKAIGYEAVYLDVDTATVNWRRMSRHAQILEEEDLVWGSNTRIDLINLSQMSELRQSGCVYMFFGVEHTVPEVSLAIGKFNGNIDQQLTQSREYPRLVKRVFSEMAQVGLPSSYFVILGLPKAVVDGGKIVDHVPTSFDDDIEAIRFGVVECDPDFLNFNMLRFMPGSAAADLTGQNAFTCVRPSGENPVTAGYFLPRVAKACGYRMSDNPGVYRLCESVTRSQPATTAVDAQRVYDTFAYACQLINHKIDAGGKATEIFVDQEISELGMVSRDKEGRYSVAPLKEFDSL